jgi:hypothetical protein
MEYIVSGSTSLYYPTYMNPDNGAIYPASTSTSSIRAQSTVAVGAAYQTYSIASSSYSPSPSPSPSPSASPMDTSMDYNDESYYSAWIATASYSVTTSDSPASASASATSTKKAMSPLKIASVGVPAVVGLILLVVGIWCCCKCRRRRKERRTEPSGAEGDDGEMMEVGSGVMRGYDRERPQSLTRNDLMGVISSPANRMRPTQPADAYTTVPYENRRYLTPSIGESRTSRWTDDSEFDVMAEDGSTITRTISTTSTRRSLATVTEAPMTNDDENPFDHPAYTYRSAPQQLNRTPGLTRNGTLSSQGTWSTQLPPLSFQSQTASSPITPITPTATAPTYLQPTHRQADTYSIHSEDSEIYGARPGLRREPTIIRHSDSTLVQGTRVEKRGRDGFVELPPLYEDAASGWAR